MRSLGLYIHIPFCKAKCIYCDFYSLPRAEGQMDAYVSALTAQLAAAVIIAILGFIAARRLKHAKNSGFVSLDAGNPVEWTGETADGHWRVRYRGADWRARPETPDTNPAAPLIISATRGNILIVKNP